MPEPVKYLETLLLESEKEIMGNNSVQIDKGFSHG